VTLLYKYCLRYVCLQGSHVVYLFLAFKSCNNVEQTLVCDTPFSVKINMYENLLALCSADRSKQHVNRKEASGQKCNSSIGLPHYPLK
jgi:hypothetical protein